jgi:peroxiredoxin
MRMKAPAMLIALSLVVFAPACGGSDPDPKTATAAKDSGGGGGGGGGNGVNKGDKAPGFTLDSLNGAGKLAIASGKVTIVDFWATWCEPCKKSFPKYQELYVKYKAAGLEIAAISVDEAETKKDIGPFIKQYGAKFPIGWDEGHKIADCYHPPNMPTAFLVDKKGVIRLVHQGFHGDDDAKKLEDEIKSLL